MNNVLLEHLECLNELNFATVPDFADHCGISNARDVLASYIEAGYVVRVWKQYRGVYSLTEAGKERLADLLAKKQPVSNSNDSSDKQPDSSKQPDSKSDSGRSGSNSPNQPSKGSNANTSGKK